MCILLLLVDLGEVIELLKNLSTYSIMAVLMVSVSLNSISTLKWQILLRALDLNFSFLRLFNYYIIGRFFNNFFPSNIGGDAFRFLLTTTEKRKFSDSFSALFMERFTGMITLLAFGFVSCILAERYYQLTVNLTYVLLILFLCMLVCLLILFLRPNLITKFSFINKYLAKIQEAIKKVLNNIQVIRKKKGTFYYALFLSLIYNFFTIINVYVAAWAIDITADLLALIVFVPIILIISNLPLSINGIGIMEGAFVLCLTQAGLSPSEALSVALLIRAKKPCV